MLKTGPAECFILRTKRKRQPELAERFFETRSGWTQLRNIFVKESDNEKSQSRKIGEPSYRSNPKGRTAKQLPNRDC
jgi:hypothetical protein